MPPKACGLILPKNAKRFGSMTECAQQGSISRYGMFKADSKQLNIAKGVKDKKTSSSIPKLEKERDKYVVQFGSLAGKIKNRKRKIETEKDSKEKTKIKKELEKIETEKKNTQQKIKDLENKIKKIKSK